MCATVEKLYESTLDILTLVKLESIVVVVTVDKNTNI